MIKGRTRLSVALELICLALVFSFVLCIIPLSAQEDAEASAGDTVDVVKLVKNVERGVRIGKEDFEIVKVRNVNVPANVISDPEQVEYFGINPGSKAAKDQSIEPPARAIHMVSEPVAPPAALPEESGADCDAAADSPSVQDDISQQ